MDVESYLGSRGIQTREVVDELATAGWRIDGPWLVIPWTNADGETIYESRRSLNGTGPKYKNQLGPRPPLWATPEARVDAGPVALAEGPFDALAVLSAVGFPAFAAFGTELSDDAADELATHDRVVVFPDSDEAGRRLVEGARLKLARRTDLRVAAYDAKDAAELIVTAGADAIADAWNNAERLLPDYTSWAPIDAAALLAGELVDEPPKWFTRSDGAALLYEGKMHSFSGEPESLKSFAAQSAGAEALRAGRDVVYLDFEDSPGAVFARMRDLGVSDELLASGFHYVRPVEPLTDAAWLDLAPTLARAPALVILDGVTEAMTLQGLNLDWNTDAAQFTAILPRRLTTCGAAVVSIDHVAKSREKRGRFAIGAQHKLAGLDGAAYVFEPATPAGRGLDGASEVIVTKDRSGFVRAVSAEGRRAGMFRLSASSSPLVAELVPAIALQDSATGLSIAETRVLATLPAVEVDGVTVREIGDRLASDGLGPPLKRTTIQDCLEEIATAGLADAERPGNGLPNRWWKR